ncbi:MAG: hypothetical protein ABEJ36_03325 [Candidatus Nanosalina sp.]
MDLLEQNDSLEVEYCPELADDIEALLQPDYQEEEPGLYFQEDPLELLYESDGSGNLELDEENSSRVREFLEPYGNADEDQREEYFADRIVEFDRLELDGHNDINFVQMQPYVMRNSIPPGQQDLRMSEVTVGYDNRDQKQYWVGDTRDGDTFLVTGNLLKTGEFLYMIHGEEPKVEFMPGQEFRTLDHKEHAVLELPQVLDLTSQIHEGLEEALTDAEPSYELNTEPIEQQISRKIEDPRDEERIRRRIGSTEQRSKFASDPEDVFEKRMSGDLQPLLQVSDKKKNGGIDLRALFAGPEVVPEVEDDTYHGVFFGVKKNSENEQKKFGDQIDNPEAYARRKLREHDII